ncbi:uncharacterized membrane protein YbhN (UPF0104 family) [Actinoplanes octamycinicus]|uniref:Uncharacterized membrane protein YbhN (UPF0104 family) n=1 Tax=Actinoplanes octamycinicus TaxID=135948 RepID=A0A7W7MAM6_9ACTN|nr:YbhN family protein [Actinoplanes octamycinicus]MBB4743147.1 uncharacterized membrane protein YbhN (UPF0104 family) [Actinoplanes octamycinicus]GIE61291.1 hypothetical protein Aoc01nite_66930 [Actinoplanes octamycinicus]
MLSALRSVTRRREAAIPPVLRRWWRPGLGIVVTVAILVTLRDQLPDLGSLLTVWRELDLGWAAAAVIAGFVSQVAFAEQQRLLLAGLDVRLPRDSAIALTVSGAAVSMAVPAGAAVATAFTFRTFRRYGASTPVATAVTVVSGVVSMLSLALLYAFGWLISSDLETVPWRPAVIAAGVAVAGYLGWRFRSAFAPSPGSRLARIAAAAARTTAEMAAIPARRWVSIFAAGAAKWVLDLFCLAAAATACHATLGWWRIAVIYLGIQIVRQIPLTPGGTGLIEVVMLAALVAAGCSHPAAAAIVVLYRLITMWLVLLMGVPAYLWLRRDLRAG